MSTRALQTDKDYGTIDRDSAGSPTAEGLLVYHRERARNQAKSALVPWSLVAILTLSCIYFLTTSPAPTHSGTLTRAKRASDPVPVCQGQLKCGSAQYVAKLCSGSGFTVTTDSFVTYPEAAVVCKKLGKKLASVVTSDAAGSTWSVAAKVVGKCLGTVNAEAWTDVKKGSNSCGYLMAIGPDYVPGHVQSPQCDSTTRPALCQDV
ncbi:hypothetical protein HK104_007026 [Borealophlyctis nickersoniae]|nr:hypothetical protein HK104_007026 [Borealophlyctis nickersoniae]